MSFGAFQKEDLHLAYQSLKDHAEEHIAKEPWPKNFDRSIDQEMRDCLNGYPYLADNTRMDMSTSPGYPYVGEGLSKKALFEDVEGTIIPGPRISHDYQHASHLLKRGVVPFLPYTLTLKDERVKKAKIYDVPKTRIFGCANVVHFMLMRKYFHKFLMTYYHLPIKHNFCVPSLDRLSAQWNDLVVEMIKPGTNGFDFDFEHWDRSMQKIMLHYATHIMLVGQDLPYIEKAAIVEMISAPYMIWGDHVYRSSGVLMSGALTTFMMNCLINEMIHRAAWIHLTRQIPHTVGTIYSYEKLTRGMRAGDDTITVVNPAVEEVFNGSTVAEYLRSKGMRVTDGRKNPVVAKLTPFMEMVFLKNVTQRRYGLFLPLPALADLKESCNWLRVNAEIKREMTLGNNTVLQTATNDNCTAALRAIFFHGRSIYEDVYNKLKKAFPEIKIPRYQELFSIWTTHNKFPGAHPDFATDIAPETAFAEV